MTASLLPLVRALLIGATWFHLEDTACHGEDPSERIVDSGDNW